jgi:uncharacterized protein YjbI with pentapeptide repeats
MRLTSLSTPTYSTPRRAGLQAQASTANVAQAQKAEAFTPSGRIQRQGFKNEAQVKLAIKAIETHLEELTEGSELWVRLKEVFMDEFGHIPQKAFQTHMVNLQAQLETLKGQLISEEYTGEGAYLVGLDLQGANLQWAILQWANLQGAILREADLQGASLDRANLHKAILREAKLQWAELWKANLHEADLDGADLDGANLDGAFGVPLGIEPLKCPQLKNTILEYCINQHKLSEKDSTDDRINGLLLQIRSLEQERKNKVGALLASLQN